MNTAMFDDKYIDLKNLDRDEYQWIYEAGKKGQLQCSVCTETVRLYIGIDRSPHFFHLSKGQSCGEPVRNVSEPTAEEGEYIERNGFRMPVSRTISTVEKKTEFKQPQRIAKYSPFTKGNHSFPSTENPYIKTLGDHHFLLDSNQAEAIMCTDGPLLVVAGAGSGKTRVLTARTAYMLHEKKVNPGSIMLVTFTAKAANEMKSRLLRYPAMNKKMIDGLVTGTFHSIFYRILAFHNREQWNSHKLLKKDWQKEQILKDGGRELGLDDKEFAYDLALSQIGLWKNSLIFPSHVKGKTPWEEKVASLYKHYENVKSDQGLFDFDDMLIGCYRLFSENPDILTNYQNQFQYFLIDEFQDINKVQYELMRMLASSRNICAVGDDDQSIYSFRGSDPKYLLKFEKDFPNAQMVVLKENYRSSHEIVSTANMIIEKNKERRPRVMHAQMSTSTPPTLFFPYDEEEEATMIVQDIREKIESGTYAPGDFAILFRTNTGSRAVFERLVNSSLPFTIDQDVEPFYERFIVRGMLGFLKLALDEENQHAVRDILPVLFVRNTILQDVKAESILKDCSLLESLSGVRTGFAFQEKKLRKLVTVVRSLRSLSPLTAIEAVEREFGFGDYIKKRGNEGNQLDKGSDDIRDLKVVAKGFRSLIEFLEHVAHMTGMNREMKNMSKGLTNAITLSTIHRAKGLEYKVVYVIGCVDGSIPHDYALDSYRNGDPAPLEEERRLLYVAVTRAMENLYISVPEKRRGKDASRSRFLSVLR